MKNRVLNLSLIAFFLCVTYRLPGEDAPANSASGVIGRVQSALIDVMKNGPQLGFQGRYDKLDPVIRSTHKMTTIARIVLGKNWTKLTEEQKAAFVEKFTILAVASYASNFHTHSNEEFKLLNEEPKERGQILVRSILTTGEGDHKFDYVVDKTGDSFQIINIIVDGVSDLAVKRAEYEVIMAKEGFDALMKRIQQKTEDVKIAPGH